MYKFNKSLTAIAVAASIGFASSAMAANNSGGVRVTVVNSNNKPLANATIVIKNPQTGFKRTITTDSAGKVRVGHVPIGHYIVAAQKSGYDTGKASEINVSIGQDASLVLPMRMSGMEKLQVTGSTIASIDTTSAESSLNIDSIQLARIPVPRSVDSVSQLAPGTTKGDNRFGGTSFGGSSVAENQMFIDGLNVTNFRNGVGFSNVPYEFYQQFQIKTGGYSSEFGRSTGGVVNAVTKQGTNEWHFGASAYYQPKSLGDTAPSVRANDGTWLTYRDNDSSNKINANIYASGPIIKDKLFFFAIYNPNNSKSVTDRTKSNDNLYKDHSNNAFWGARIDWNITDDQHLEYLIFSDANDAKTDVYKPTDSGGTNYNSTAHNKTGGHNWLLKYTNYLTDDFSVSAMYGENKYNLTTASSLTDTCALLYDYRYYDGAYSNVPVHGFDIGCASSSDYLIESGADTRKQYRVDFEWQLTDNHLLRFGVDHEKNTSVSEQGYSGPDGEYGLIFSAPAGAVVNKTTLAQDTDYIRTRTWSVGGSFATNSSAYYLEDQWSVTDTITAKLGLRNDTFDNMNAAGKTFADIKNMWAPRIGIAWDVNGDGESKLYFNAGRYYLPVANNTNVRLSGGESDIKRYYVLDGLTKSDFNGNTYYLPTLGTQIGTDQVVSDGSVPDTRSIVTANLKPMYQDEYILGYSGTINDEWTYDAKFTHRQLNGDIDDMIIDHAIAAKFGCDASTYHPQQYVLGNPGEDMHIYSDTNCDGTPDGWVDLTAAQLRYPKAIRKYMSLDLKVDKQWDGIWSMTAVYTWSHSYGNIEGLVKSDNGQGDAGLTQDFDFPELMDGAYGNLPNDRRHMFKVYGSVALTDKLTFGYNMNLHSGRPINATGLGYPGKGELPYGDTYFLAHDSGKTDDNGTTIYDYTRVPRGSMGETPWVFRLDLNMMYKTEIAGLQTMFKLDVFNVLNAHSYTRVQEKAERTFGVTNSYDYGRPLAYQTPRYVQFGMSVDF